MLPKLHKLYVHVVCSVWDGYLPFSLSRPTWPNFFLLIYIKPSLKSMNYLRYSLTLKSKNILILKINYTTNNMNPLNVSTTIYALQPCPTKSYTYFLGTEGILRNVIIFKFYKDCKCLDMLIGWHNIIFVIICSIFLDT